jgi:hypothetical protein
MKQTKLMGLGISAAAAAQLAEAADLTTGITAAGTTQAGAQAIYADVNVVATAAASSGVLLPNDRTAGDVVEVTNLGANSLSVYPPSGGNIGTGAANAPLALAVGKTGRYRLVSATQWTSQVSA